MSLPPHPFSFVFPAPAGPPPAQPMAGPSRAPHYAPASCLPWPMPVANTWAFPQYHAAPMPTTWTMCPTHVRPELSPLAIDHQLPQLFFPSSPTDTCSSTLSTPASGPAPLFESVIVCDVPLRAPRPLPYHSPRFLQFDDLPEPDADLSHPPYARRRPLKRPAEQSVAPVSAKRAHWARAAAHPYLRK